MAAQPEIDIAGLLMAEEIDLKAVRAAIARFLTMEDDAAHEALGRAWREVRMGGSPAQDEFRKATLLLLDSMLQLPARVRAFAGGGMMGDPGMG